MTDTYRKSYDATIVFILNTEFQFEDSNSAVWDLSVINNWIEEYPTEYSHACSLGMERKTVASDKENIQLFEKLYSEGLYLKTMTAIRMQYAPASKSKMALQSYWVQVFQRNRVQKLGMSC